MKSKWQLIQTTVVIGGLALAGFSWYTRQSELGSRFVVSDKEAVNYSGEATEDQARALAEVLSQEGFFDGQTEKDVLLKIKDQQKIVSFVVQDGKWEDRELRETFETIGELIAPSLGGLPLTVRLIDDELVSKFEIPVSTQRVLYKFSEQEFIIQRGETIDALGKELADTLHTAGYFDGSAPATVVWEKVLEKAIIGFVVQVEKAKDEAVLKYYSNLVAKISPSLGNPPLTVQLLDTSLNVLNSWEHPAP